MPKKIREIKKLLLDAGFTFRQGKGSHTNWSHPQLDKLITISRSDGDDAPRYLERLVNQAMRELNIEP